MSEKIDITKPVWDMEGNRVRNLRPRQGDSYTLLGQVIVGGQEHDRTWTDCGVWSTSGEKPERNIANTPPATEQPEPTGEYARPIARPQPDMVNHPPHYTNGGVECIDAIKAALTPEEFRGFLKGQILKYTWRERLKGGQEDMDKAGWYLAKLKGGA